MDNLIQNTILFVGALEAFIVGGVISFRVSKYFICKSKIIFNRYDDYEFH